MILLFSSLDWINFTTKSHRGNNIHIHLEDHPTKWFITYQSLVDKFDIHLIYKLNGL